MAIGTDLARVVQGKVQAATTLYDLTRLLSNWSATWSAYRGGSQPPPLKLRGGPTIYHEVDDDPFCLLHEIFVDRCYTRNGFYSPRAGDTVLDLGANVGFFTLFLEWQARGIRVHAYEPGALARSRLEHNVAANDLGGSVTIHPVAISDRSGTILLSSAERPAQRSAFANEFGDGGKAEEVACLSLDEAVERTGAERIALLKMDIEGAEIEAAEGASAATWAKIDRVAYEYHDRFRPGCRDRVAAVLRAHGFAHQREAMPTPLEGLGLIQAHR